MTRLALTLLLCASAGAAMARENRYAGHIRLLDGERIFTPCAGGEQYRPVGVARLMDELDRAAGQDRSGMGAFVRLRAYFTPLAPTEDRAAARVDGRLAVSRIYELRRWSPEDCADERWR